jgi:alpha-aminoadipate carrier protein LysW
MGNNQTECPICGLNLSRPEDVMINELLECPDCRTELEVKALNPYLLEEAPQEEEDWGE